MSRNESKYKIKTEYLKTNPLKIQYLLILDKHEYGRQKTLFGHLNNLISKWSGISEKMTLKVYLNAKITFNRANKFL